MLCLGTAWKTWSNLMLLIASWLIRFIRNSHTLNPPNNHFSPKRRIYYTINFFPRRFSKVKSLTAIKFLLHILIYFSLQLGNVSKTYFGVLYCRYLSFIKKIFVATYSIHSEFETCVTFSFSSGRSEISIKSLGFWGLNGKDQMPSADVATQGKEMKVKAKQQQFKAF